MKGGFLGLLKKRVYSLSNRERNWDIGRLYSLSLRKEADLALGMLFFNEKGGGFGC